MAPDAAEGPESVDRRRELLRLRTFLTERLEDADTPANAVAALSKELRTVVAELEQLAAPDAEESPLDELKRRRAARLTGTGDPSQPGRRSQPRRSGGSSRTG